MAIASKNPQMLKAGFNSLEGGIDYGLPPDLIADNQVSLAINTTFRGGYPHPRPAVRKVQLTFANDFGLTETRFKGGVYQRFGYYDPGQGNSQVLIGSIGGNFFRIDPVKQFCEILPDPGPQQRGNQFSLEGWCVQAGPYWVFQNRVQAPVIWDNSKLRRASGDTDTPQGTAMAFEFNRLWVARGLQYFAGDILGGPNPVTSFTENQYLNDGGSFYVPSPHDEITAMKGIPNLNTALGTSDLAVYTQGGMWLNACPASRATWKDSAIQRVGLTDNGSLDQDIVSINGDHWFRSEDGIRSGVMSVRNFADEGNVPQSGEIGTILNADSQALLQYGSGVKFENRLLRTVSPVRTNKGVYFRGLAVLDFDLVSRMRNKFPPAWEGIWVFGRILQVISGRFGNQKRCFAFVMSQANEIELWEISANQHFDQWDASPLPISWGIDFKAYNFNTPDLFKKLEADSFLNVTDMEGRVHFNVYYRPDDNPCWQFWHGWSEESKMGDCPPLTCFPTTYQPQGRKPMRLPQPADTCDPVSGRLNRAFYQVQARVLLNGYCTLKRFGLLADVMPPEPHAAEPCLTDAPAKEATCCDDPFEWDSYGVLGPAVGVGGGFTQGSPSTTFAPAITVPITPPIIPPPSPSDPTVPPIVITPSTPDPNANTDMSGKTDPGTVPETIQYCSIWVFTDQFLALFDNQDAVQFAFTLLRNEFINFLAGTGLPKDIQGNALDHNGTPIIYQVPPLSTSPATPVAYDAEGNPIYLGKGNVRWTAFNNSDSTLQQSGRQKFNTGNPVPDVNVDSTLVEPIVSGKKLCLWYFV